MGLIFAGNFGIISRVGIFTVPGEIKTIVQPNFEDVQILVNWDGTGKVAGGYSSFTATISQFDPVSFPNCAYFDGNSVYHVPKSSSFSFGVDDFTVEMWVKPDSFATSFRTLLDMRDAAAFEDRFVINLIYDGAVSVYVNGITVNYVNNMTFGSWNHVAFVRYNSKSRIYVNGVGSSEYNLTTSFPDAQIRIGQNAASGYGFVGYNDENRIVTGHAVYRDDFTPPGPHPTA